MPTMLQTLQGFSCVMGRYRQAGLRDGRGEVQLERLAVVQGGVAEPHVVDVCVEEQLFPEEEAADLARVLLSECHGEAALFPLQEDQVYPVLVHGEHQAAVGRHQHGERPGVAAPDLHRLCFEAEERERGVQEVHVVRCHAQLAGVSDSAEPGVLEGPQRDHFAVVGLDGEDADDWNRSAGDE